VKTYKIHNGDCLDVLPTLPAASVDLILTDPPFFRVKSEAWDRQWATPAEFLAGARWPALPARSRTQAGC